MFEDQIHIQVMKLESAVSTMAWNLAAQIMQEQHKRVVSGLTEVAIKAEKSPPKLLRVLALINSKEGLWDRGGGPYKIVGRGKVSNTYVLKNIQTNNKITVTLRTLAFKWNHIP